MKAVEGSKTMAAVEGEFWFLWLVDSMPGAREGPWAKGILGMILGLNLADTETFVRLGLGAIIADPEGGQGKDEWEERSVRIY